MARKQAARRRDAPGRTPAARAVTEATEAAVAASTAADEAAEALSAIAAAHDVDPDDPLLDTAIRQLEAGADDDRPFGSPGAPIAPHSPFRVAFVATWGVLTALVLALAIRAVRDVLVLVVIAVFLAVGLDPAVEWLQRKGAKRSVAVGVVIGGVVLFLAGFVAAAVPPVASQVDDLRRNVPAYVESLRENRTFRNLDDEFGVTERLTAAVRDSGTDAATKVVSIVGGVLGYIFKTLTVLILTLYFLSAYPSIKRGAYRLVPRSRRARVGLMADEILSRVGGYVLGNIATSMVAGTVSLVLFLALDVPAPFALAMLVAILDLIPLVGATIAAVVCTIVAFFSSTFDGVVTLGFFVAYQQIENYVLVPRVMKRAVDVSPLATIVAALVGGGLLGVVGALLAIPVAAAIQLVGSEVIVPRQDAS